MATIEQIFEQLKNAMETEKNKELDDLRVELQKCKSRLDQDQLNFKYSTLLDTYNEAEHENKKLRNELTVLAQKYNTLAGEQQNLQGEYDKLRSQCIEALNENRQLRLRITQPYENFSFIPPTHGLNRVMFLKDF